MISYKQSFERGRPNDEKAAKIQIRRQGQNTATTPA